MNITNPTLHLRPGTGPYITNSAEPFDLDVKRFYIPGAKIEGVPCKNCGRLQGMDFSNEYLSYPEANKPIKVTFYCGDTDGCEAETTVWITLCVTIEPAK